MRGRLTRGEHLLLPVLPILVLTACLGTTVNAAALRVPSEYSGIVPSADSGSRWRLLNVDNKPVDVGVFVTGTAATDNDDGDKQTNRSLSHRRRRRGAGGVGGLLNLIGQQNDDNNDLFAYEGPTDQWFEKSYGRIITGFAVTFGVVFVGLFIYGMFVAYYKTKYPGLRTKPKISVTKITPRENIEDDAWRSRKAHRQPSFNDDNDDTPNAHSPPPSQPVPQAPRSNDISTISRAFDGKAVDPETGRVYEFNTQTNERRWT